MSLDLSNKRIIMIHGLASKPAEDSWFDLWQQCVTENIATDDKVLAKTMEADSNLFRSAYWANASPHHIEDDAAYVKKLQAQVAKAIAERKRIRDGFHVGTKEKIDAFFKDRGVDVVKTM
jgi:Arc/MetJ family transcription regulator